MRFVLDHRGAIASARPAIPPILNDRAADLSEPLLAMVDEAGGDWPALARQAMVGLIGSAEENDPVGALLLDIRVIFEKTGGKRMFSRTLAADCSHACGRTPTADEAFPLGMATATVGRQPPFGTPFASTS